MNNYEKIINELLRKRGIPETEQSVFLLPDFDRDTHDPWQMKGMVSAVDRVEAAIRNRESVAIFGDYDADGVPATALLARGFRHLGVEVTPVIPTRSAGYGLNADAVTHLIHSGVSLLITVDNGTVAKEEIATLAAAGIDVIVCDHHQPQEGHLADRALAILNPKQPGCPYPFKDLCGCAIAWKLLSALFQKMEKDNGFLKWELDLVAFSTIADMVPLLGENRVLATYGLKVLRKSRNIGVKALAEAADTDLATVHAGTVGYRLAPRINAPSRMHQEVWEGENAALKLLITDDAQEAKRLAAHLNTQNADRQHLLERHLQEADALSAGGEDQLSLVVYGEEWSTGVIGLVAGRLLERYKRPVVVLAKEGGVIKGSVRSVEGVDAVQLLQAGDVYLEKYGGHSRAAGLTFLTSTTDQVGRFRDDLNRWMVEQGWQLGALAEATSRKPDMELPLDAVEIGLAEKIGELEPFGIGFPAPLFSARCRLALIRRVGSTGQHLACVLEQNRQRKKAIGFGMGDLPAEEKEYEVHFTVRKEEWNGQPEISCHIERIVL